MVTDKEFDGKKALVQPLVVSGDAAVDEVGQVPRRRRPVWS